MVVEGRVGNCVETKPRALMIDKMSAPATLDGRTMLVWSVKAVAPGVDAELNGGIDICERGLVDRKAVDGRENHGAGGVLESWERLNKSEVGNAGIVRIGLLKPGTPLEVESKLCRLFVIGGLAMLFEEKLTAGRL